MDYRSFVRVIVGLGMLASAGCAQQELQTPDVDGLAQAETTYPPATPISIADRVNWHVAAQPVDVDNLRSDFRRAQSLMAKLSVASYETQESFDAKMKPYGFVGQHVNGAGTKISADAYVGGSERIGMMFVAVRGTSNVADYFTDLFAAPELAVNSSVQGSVHTGFALYADALYSQIRPVLDVSCHPDATQRVPLWLTGHSLGAAAASILASRLASEGCNVAGVVLFGSPRPGFSDFKASYESLLPDLTQRWTTQYDPIYCLPPGGAWRHVGAENTIADGVNIIGSDDESRCDSPEGWLGDLKNGLEAIDPATVATSKAAEAVNDWLLNKFVLGIVCDANTRWDDVYTLGLCSVTDYGYGILSTYNVTPQELITAAVSFKLKKFHRSQRYADALEADFSEEEVPVATVRLLLANDLGNEIFQDVARQGFCTPSAFDDGTFFCDFQAPVGSVLRITGGDAIGAVSPAQCDREANVIAGTPFVCELNVTDSIQIQVTSTIVI